MCWYVLFACMASSSSAAAALSSSSWSSYASFVFVGLGHVRAQAHARKRTRSRKAPYMRTSDAVLVTPWQYIWNTGSLVCTRARLRLARKAYGVHMYLCRCATRSGRFVGGFS